jgi:hypothetical protein
VHRNKKHRVSIKPIKKMKGKKHTVAQELHLELHSSYVGLEEEGGRVLTCRGSGACEGGNVLANRRRDVLLLVLLLWCC